MIGKSTPEDMLPPEANKGLGFVEGWLSIGINTSLFFLKLWAGMRIASVAMVADAWHTLSDSLTSAVVLLGFWLSTKPADDRHHFGHGRAEAVASLVIGTLLAVVGFSFLKDSVSRLARHQAVAFELLGIVVFFASAVIKEALARFSLWAGKKIHSRVLIADAWHHRSDAVASALVAAGALFGKRVWWLDGAMGVGVSLLILYATYSIMRSAVSYLLGESPGKALEIKIHETIRGSDSRLDSVHHVHVHDYGEHREVTAHIKLPGGMSLDDAHAIASKAEKTLKEQLNLETTIHVEPAEAQPPDEEEDKKK
ncbi:MAG: cation diffusion facilitator family transporter [Clostridiales bacterium]|nr:cation diffusion facilitator family transporter [Clostridiales bacterium]